MANTAILYEGKWTAIFMVDGTEDLDILTSKIVHEMFHAFQNDNQEGRFPNEIAALSEFQYTPDNLSNKLIENKILFQLLETKDMKLWETIKAMKNFRKNHFPISFDYEIRVEQIEGTANFVEMKTLEILNQQLFEQKFNKMKANLHDAKAFLPIRVSLYDSGALLLYVMDQLNIKYDQSFSDQPLVRAIINDCTLEEAPQPLKEVRVAIDDFRKSQVQIIERATQNPPIREGNFKLTGLNVFNAWHYRGLTYSTYFLSFEDKGKNEILYGNFLIEMKDGKITKIYLDE